MKRLRSIKALKTEAWLNLSRYVRNKEKKCCTCGGPNDHAGHFQFNSERNQQLGGNELWYEERNIHSQCVVCNNYKSGNLVPYTIFMEKTYGIGIVQELYQLWRKPKKWTRAEIQEVIDRYKPLVH